MRQRMNSFIILLICYAYFLLGFGFTKAYKVEKTIDSIGIVTMESRKKIETAERMYAELSEKNKAKVDNYDTLVLARQELDSLEGLVYAAEVAIDAIQEPITLDSWDSILAALTAYRAAQEASVHGYVTNFGKTRIVMEQYPPLAIEAADRLMKQRKYDEALSLYSQVCTYFSASGYCETAYQGCQEAYIGMADGEINAGRWGKRIGFNQ